jgi:hypothetical protein
MELMRAILFIALLSQCQAFFTETTIFENPCPKHWIQATWVEMGCLLFNSTTAYTWEEANNYCQDKENASLVEIYTEEQHEFLKMELNLLSDHEGGKAWRTAGTDIGNEGMWF